MRRSTSAGFRGMCCSRATGAATGEPSPASSAASISGCSTWMVITASTMPGTSRDVVFDFGGAGDKPVTGAW